MELKECLHCGSDAELEEDRNIFHGQSYTDRYPPDVANQNHGYRVRCVKCGCQTCWWHYKQEACETWNKRHLTSQSKLEQHYRETLEYVADYAIKREHVVYCDHIAQVIIAKLKE